MRETTDVREAAFQQWWRASKYRQVVFPKDGWEQIARDGFNAAWNRRALTPSEDVAGVVEKAREAIRQRAQNHWATEGCTKELVEEIASGKTEWQALDALVAQIASLSAKLAAVEGERGDAIARGEEQWALWVKADCAHRAAQARASELQREVERLRKAIDDALGRHQVTHIHAGLRAALQQEGE